MNPGILEAPPGFEPGMEVLQTSALPLGDGAGRNQLYEGGSGRRNYVRLQQRDVRAGSGILISRRSCVSRCRNPGLLLSACGCKRAAERSRAESNKWSGKRDSNP